MTNNTDFTLPNLSCLELQFQLRAQQDCELRAFKGSMLRGAFGQALRKTVCIMSPNQICGECLIRSQCANTRIFETVMIKDPPRFLQGMDMAPKPFILYCDDDRSVYQKNDLLTFSMKLLGSAIDFYPYVIYSVDRMAKFGFTRRKARFELQKVDCIDVHGEKKQIYDGQQQQLSTGISVYNILSNRKRDNPQNTLDIHFLTPTRFKINGQYADRFTFRQLVFVMLRRHLELAHFYGNAADINWEFHDLLVAAEAVEMVESNLQWQEHYRYSNRQKSDMFLGGVTGSIRLRGDVSPFGNLLQSASVLHVGKGTTFGLGKVEYKAQV